MIYLRGMLIVIVASMIVLLATPCFSEEVPEAPPAPAPEYSENTRFTKIKLCNQKWKDQKEFLKLFVDNKRWSSLTAYPAVGHIYYDKKTLSITDKYVTIWIKEIPTETCVSESYSSLYSDFDKIYEMDYVNKIDCKQNKFMQPIIKIYDNNSKLLAQYENDESIKNFSYIQPETFIDEIKEKFCPKQKKKSRK